MPCPAWASEPATKDNKTPLAYVGVLEVVEAVAGEDEPSPLPRLDAPALLGEPSLALGVVEGEEGHVLLHADLLLEDGLVELEEQALGDVTPVVDAAIVAHKGLARNLVLDRRVVQVRVEHDQRERQHVCRIYLCRKVQTQQRQQREQSYQSWQTSMGCFRDIASQTVPSSDQSFALHRADGTVPRISYNEKKPPKKTQLFSLFNKKRRTAMPCQRRVR